MRYGLWDTQRESHPPCEMIKIRVNVYFSYLWDLQKRLTFLSSSLVKKVAADGSEGLWFSSFLWLHLSTSSSGLWEANNKPKIWAEVNHTQLWGYHKWDWTCPSEREERGLISAESIHKQENTKLKTYFTQCMLCAKEQFLMPNKNSKITVRQDSTYLKCCSESRCVYLIQECCTPWLVW